MSFWPQKIAIENFICSIFDDPQSKGLTTYQKILLDFSFECKNVVISTVSL